MIHIIVGPFCVCVCVLGGGGGLGGEEIAKHNLQAFFLAVVQEIHAGSLHEKLENLPFQHIA